jgi:hypothetical protein
MEDEARNRETLESELVTHEGSRLEPAINARGTQQHMGALEDNMQVVSLPTYDEEDEQMPARQSHKLQTPG